ncbi:Premnaspirodiene oxygenase [Dichanthelium oligosanthes]|uniref:Premnaspirodiene oxygenase n=1 Tax=Dichanthelium oligosanthes TaxID=888268 RepID=A0A1E5USR9_9POAL|nr:Premnaspirodiene oxygenase [Dichanthelium oligosanthes]
MDSSAAVYYCILAILPLLCIIKSCISCTGSHHHGLRLPPGPWKLPLIGSIHRLIGAHPHSVLRDLSRRHSPLVSLKFSEVPVIVIYSREAADEVMKTQDAILASRQQIVTVKIIDKHGSDIALAPVRRPVAAAPQNLRMLELLRTKHVQSFRAIREEEVTRLVQAMSSASRPLVNLSEFLTTYANDVTVRSVMGDRLKDRNTFLSYVTTAIQLVGTFRVADLFPSSRLACALSSKMGKTELYMDSLFEFMDNIISERHEKKIQREARQEDMTDVLLRIHKERKLQFPLTMGTIKAVLFDLLSGGTESVSTVLDWTMAELMRNPLAMSRAQSEVRRAFMGQMKVTEEGLRELSYLHWVIKETLRLHAPGPILLPRESQGRCRVLGYDIPKGTMILVNAWAISRDSKYTGTSQKHSNQRDLRLTQETSKVMTSSSRHLVPADEFALVSYLALLLSSWVLQTSCSILTGVSRMVLMPMN